MSHCITCSNNLINACFLWGEWPASNVHIVRKWWQLFHLFYLKAISHCFRCWGTLRIAGFFSIWKQFAFSYFKNELLTLFSSISYFFQVVFDLCYCVFIQEKELGHLIHSCKHSMVSCAQTLNGILICLFSLFWWLGESHFVGKLPRWLK